MAQRQLLLATLEELMQPDRFRDVAPNGLQVEGRERVDKIVSGVTASQRLIEEAIACRADAIIVHHGLFWRGQDGRVVGWMRRRLSLLLQHNVNLFAYHLPLDAHIDLGNNAQLGLRLGLRTTERFGDQELGFLGERADGGCFDGSAALQSHVESVLGRTSTCVGERQEPIRRIAWCTGGAQSYFEAAIAAGADAFLTGEISEPQAHFARESGVTFLACGHHATERYGAAALASHVASCLGLEHEFIDIDNPA